MSINEDQKSNLITYLNNFLENSTVINDGIEEDYNVFDQKRVTAIKSLKDSVDKFLKTLQTKTSRNSEMNSSELLKNITISTNIQHINTQEH